MSFLLRGDKEVVDRLVQGDILRHVDMPEYSKVTASDVTVTIVRFPFAVVLTQDCDLEQDYRFASEKTDRFLISTLVAPAYRVADAQAGTHLEGLGRSAIPLLPPQRGNSAKAIYRNNNPRYHHLPLSSARAGLPDLIVDFKHYFTVNTRYLERLKSEDLLGSLSDQYRDDLSQRFATYLSRIGLPRQITENKVDGDTTAS